MVSDVVKVAAKLPMACIGSFDPEQHKTVSDLVDLVKHELDLYEEGEENDIRTARDFRACKKFIADFGA